MKFLNHFIMFVLLTIGTCAQLKMSGDASPPCYRQLEVAFFNENLVAQALALYRIDQSLWTFIARDLRSASSRVPVLVQAQARSFNPNPLQRPFNPDGAFKILEASLYAVYFPVLDFYRNQTSNSNINNNTIQDSFRYIWLQQQDYLVKCLGG
jgi:hypothetical protein